MKTKKIFASSLVAAMAMSAFAGCSSNTGTDTTATTGANGETAATTAAPAETTKAPESYGSGTITIWVADNVVDFTKKKAEEFLASNPAFSGYTVAVEAVGEGDAASKVVTDIGASADLYGFAQDQLARLVSAGAIASLSDADQKWVEDNNDGGAYAASCVGDWAYAYPMTSDNGYFLYYDKSVVTDTTTLEGILKQCEDAGKNFYMDLKSGWYNTAFFFATGCSLDFKTDEDGNYTEANVTYASDAGLVAMREIIDVAASSAFINGSSVAAASNAAVVVSGTWDSDAAKTAFGDNYACAKLPTFTGSDGKEYQMSGFGGFKLLGVKPQEDELKLSLCNQLAQYLTNADTQLARFKEAGWGPSNVTAQASEEVKNDPALSALAAQLNFCIPQGQYPGDYWTRAEALVTDVVDNKTITQASSDADVLAALQAFQDDCIGYCTK